MKATLINPITETVTAVEHNGDYRQIYELLSDSANGLRVTVYTAISLTRREHLFVDDEGLLKDPKYFFTITGYDQPLAGRGLILGSTRGGKSTRTKIHPELIRTMVKFCHLSVRGFQMTEGKKDHPILGDIFTITNRPMFGPPRDKDN